MATDLQATRPSDVGPLLRDVRLTEGMTQVELAERARVGRQWLNAFELGDKPSAPLDMVMRVAAALDARVLLTRPAPSKRPRREPIDLDALLREYDT